MIRETEDHEGEKIVVTVPYEVYLAGRDDSIHAMGSFEIRKSIISEEYLIDSIMYYVLNHIRGTFETVGETRFVLSDERFNKFYFKADQIQAVSVSAPDEETIRQLMES